ncbi:MAG TPA: bifunctional 5,10-methylenetetrahydrofolate dehydrogenase/5,10-methenyltetrahydrofolate cyclohydrolase [Patescibacteria group bacterium]|nr:bifunctional 5,10-methylenetetrahydrofolate dehydrogenase/5,10-methenyltetrahydrofolate cyclohydrolase [Patescibacteria group bacterium]
MTRVKILDGRPVASRLLADVSRRAIKLHGRGVTPTLAVVLVGHDSASNVYVGAKQKIARQVGIDFLLYRLNSVRQEELEQLLITLHLDHSVHGVIIQLPIPQGLSLSKALKFLDKTKDVDALTPDSDYKSPTASAVVALLQSYNIDYHREKVAVIGRGVLVGQPLERIFVERKAEVNIYDDATKNIAAKVARAKIVISATGKPGLIDENFLSAGQVVIDVGCARDPKTNAVVGDVDRAAARKVVSAITPRLGGVGPVTVALLMQNVILAAEKSSKS